MQDKGHCMMPFDDDTEFEYFYDFARLYRDLPQKTLALESAAQDVEGSFNLAEERKIAAEQKAANAAKSVQIDTGKTTAKNTGAQKEDDEWEDCDLESGD
jgi:hypothetical protein